MVQALRRWHEGHAIGSIAKRRLYFLHAEVGMRCCLLSRVLGGVYKRQILNIINHQCLIATKASRVVIAAGGDGIMEFGLRPVTCTHPTPATPPSE